MGRRVPLHLICGMVAISTLAMGCGGMLKPASTGGLPREKIVDGEKYVLVRNQLSRSPFGPGQGGVPEFIYVREDIATKGPPSLGNLVLGVVGAQTSPAKSEVKVKPEDQGPPQGTAPVATPPNPLIVRPSQPQPAAPPPGGTQPSRSPAPQVLPLTQPAAPPPPAVVAAVPPVAPSPPPGAPAPTLKRRVAVLGFDTRGPGAWGAVELEVAQLLVGALKAASGLLVVDPLLVVEALARHGAKPGEVPQEGILAQVGRELSLQAFLWGTVSGVEVGSPSAPAGVSVQVELAVLEGLSGRRVKTVARALPLGGRESVGELVGALTQEVIPELEALPWSSRIAVVEGEKVYLPVGQQTGLKVSDRLEVYAPGEEVIDPVTQRSLGVTPGVTKGRIQVMALFGTDAAMAVITEGKGFSPNDLVRPLSP